VSEILFAYGTLQPGLAPTAMRDVVEQLRPLGRATVRGTLYHLGAYPGLVLEPSNGNRVVHGQLLELPDDPMVWGRLDSYEGFAPDEPQRSLFRRVRCQALRDDGTGVECWTYVFNGDLARAGRIHGGTWYPDRAPDRLHEPESTVPPRPRRPVIGLTMSSFPETPARYDLAMDYATAVERAGGLPWPLPFKADLSLIPEFVDHLDGVLFTGGDDLDPALYGETRHPRAEPVHPDRQRFELALIAEIERRRMPALGVCLGCQLMNVYRGGSLIQFLPDQQRDSALEHRKLNDDSRRHRVKLEPGTRLAEAIARPEITVNTRHKQAVARPGKGLRVIAKAPDGVVEAIEDPSLPFFMAVQWHPENLSDQPEHLAPFKLLVEAARRAKAERAPQSPSVPADQ
jgi:putative glutamine amidotransferase